MTSSSRCPAEFLLRRRLANQARQRGFTLIELFIAVAIVGILLAVAVPSYTDYLRRGQLQESVAFLADYRVKMEQYYQDFRNYGTGSTCANGSPAPTWAGFAPAAAKYFTFSCALSNSGQGYTVTATGRTGTRAAGHEYTIDHSNNPRQTTRFKDVAVTGKACWLLRGDEC